MKCPYCGYADSRVIDSRESASGVRRRRQCLSCSTRFTTYEQVQSRPLYVIKKDKRREEFDGAKLLRGLHKACDKRPLQAGMVEGLAEEIEAELYRMGKSEVPGYVIGDLVMAGLKRLDHVAYIRFASVYREFADIDEMKQEIDTLASQPALMPGTKLVEVTRGSTGGRRRRAS